MNLLKKLFMVLVEETKSIRELSVLSMPFRRLWQTSKIEVVLAITFAILEAGLYTLDPIILRYLLDVWSAGDRFGWQQPLPPSLSFLPAATCMQGLFWLTMIMLAASFLTYASFNTSTGFGRDVTYRSQVTFGTEAYRHILGLSMDFHVQSRRGELLMKTDNAIREAQDFLYNSFFSNFLRAGLSIVMVLTVIYGMDKRAFCVCAATLALSLYLNLVFGSRISKLEKAAWQNVSEVQAIALDAMGNIKEVKAFCREEHEVQRRQQRAEQQLHSLRRIMFLWRWLTTTINIIQLAGFGVVFTWVILPGAFTRRFTVGQGAQFVSLYLMLFGYFMDLLFKYLNAQRLVPKLKDLKNLLGLGPSVVDRPGAANFPGLLTGLELKDATFSYAIPGQNGKANGQGNVLEQIRLVIPKGKRTVLVGKTGCGKSTLVNLLMRLYDPSSGAVLADGTDIRQYTQQSYRRAFTLVSQEAYLFRETVAYNIAYSRIGASREEVIEAAKIAQAHDFIMQLPEGYDTIVSERAANLSGGQKQRIVLARAVLARDAEVIVLDEPTTGLDTVTAREFLSELFQVFPGKTLVTITHDPEVMRCADRIVFVENGKIGHVGSHSELAENCEGYRRLAFAN